MTDHMNETIIDFIDSEDTCHVYTHKATWQRYFASQGIKGKTTECGGMDFDIPKKWLLMPKNRTRTLTDAQRAALVKRGKRLARGQKKDASFVSSPY